MARPSSSGLCQPAISAAKATGAYGLILFIDEFQELAGPRQPFGDPDARGGWHALKPIDEATWLGGLAARFETVGRVDVVVSIVLLRGDALDLCVAGANGTSATTRRRPTVWRGHSRNVRIEQSLASAPPSRGRPLAGKADQRTRSRSLTNSAALTKRRSRRLTFTS